MPLAHVLIGALDEAALFVALADDPHGSSRGRRGASTTGRRRRIGDVARLGDEFLVTRTRSPRLWDERRDRDR